MKICLYKNFKQIFNTYTQRKLMLHFCARCVVYKSFLSVQCVYIDDFERARANDFQSYLYIRWLAMYVGLCALETWKCVNRFSADSVYLLSRVSAAKSNRPRGILSVLFFFQFVFHRRCFCFIYWCCWFSVFVTLLLL